MSVKKISFVSQSENETKASLLYLTSSVSKFKSEKRKLSSIIKTLELFELERKGSPMFKFLVREYGLSCSKQEFDEIREHIKYKAEKKIKIENYYFVQNLVYEEDLQFLNNRFLKKEEIQFYLYKISQALLEEKYEGTRTLSRNYLLKFADNYKRNTGRTLNKNKIAYMNKLLVKLGLLQTQDFRKFYIGENHPLFHTSLVSEEVRHVKFKNIAPLNEQIREAKQDYDNLVSGYQELQAENEALKKQIEDMKKNEIRRDKMSLIVAKIEDLKEIENQEPVYSFFDFGSPPEGVENVEDDKELYIKCVNSYKGSYKGSYDRRNKN